MSNKVAALRIIILLESDFSFSVACSWSSGWWLRKRIFRR
jgi:hypothetical protein